MDQIASTLTLQDIADLARVRRSTVSMWRNRPVARGQFLPFPPPVDIHNGVEQFGRQEIVDWLERTGRGNNHEHRLDAPALSVPADVSLEDLVSLLCLQVLSGEELAETTAGQRESMANDVDADDTFLNREVKTAKIAAAALSYIDDLVEASFGPAEALASLESGRIGRAMGDRDLTAHAVNLLHTVAKACQLHIDPDGVPVNGADGNGTLALALAGDFAHLVVHGDSAAQRAVRRRAAICGIETADNVTGPCVHVCSVVGLDPDEALDTIDNLVIELDKGDLAVALGPSSVMCEELRGEQEQKRAQTLRPGHLVLALRLPRGLWREAHRQALGLWVCAGGVSSQGPFVADLTAVAEHELEMGDLAADVAGAVAQDIARAFRYARPHKLPLILTGGSVVPRGARAQRFGTTDIRPHLDRIHVATLVTAEPGPSLDIFVAASQGSMILRRRSLGEMKDLNHVQVKRGSRIDADLADPAGSVAVRSADNQTAVLMLDPFDAVRRYRRAARTEPGDVVFTERPRPRALVDDLGGSLVMSPSKILRLEASAGIGPHGVAAIINQLPVEATEWQAWSVPILDDTAIEQLEDALVAAADYEKAVRRRLHAVQDLIKALIDGAAAGAVTLTTQPAK